MEKTHRTTVHSGPMSIAAQSLAPVFHHRKSLTAAELQRLDEACVIMEHSGLDTDFAPYWVYTIGGVLDGRPLPEGCTTAGDVIIISGVASREEADDMASQGLLATQEALDEELRRYVEGQNALTRLNSVSPSERMAAALKPAEQKNEDFAADMAAIRPLIGDDILLAAGEVAPGPSH